MKSMTMTMTMTMTGEEREGEGVTLHVEQIVEVVVECSEQRNFCEQQISRAEQLRAAANPPELETDLQLKKILQARYPGNRTNDGNLVTRPLST